MKNLLDYLEGLNKSMKNPLKVLWVILGSKYNSFLNYSSLSSEYYVFSVLTK